jgi:hypothetical protein
MNKILFGKLKGKDHSQDLDVDGENIKVYLRE